MTPEDDVRTAQLEILQRTGNPPNTMVLPMETVEQLNPDLAERLKAVGPDVEVPTHLPTDRTTAETTVDDEVRVINLRDRTMEPKTNRLVSTVESPRPKNIWFVIQDVALDKSLQMNKEIVPEPTRPGLRVTTTTFKFNDQPTLEAHRMYLFTFMEAGRTRIFQKIQLSETAKIGWIKTKTARPGAKACMVWVEIRTEDGDVISRSTRRLFGRDPK